MADTTPPASLASGPDETEKRDFAIVMRCIQRIVTMPNREHTYVPTADLKAFARLVTAQFERLAAQESSLRAALSENERLRREQAQTRNALCVLLDHLELGDADVLSADAAWVEPIVASFSASFSSTASSGERAKGSETGHAE